MKCSGQDTRYWGPEDIYEVTCSECGYLVEFFKDEPSRRCPQCGKRIKNPKLNLGCAQWCKYAKECLGFDPKELEIQNEQEEALLDRLIQAMKDEFGSDQKRITHALLVLEHAQAILREEGGDPKVVLAAAVLHDIGIQEAERKYGSSAGHYQEIEGPPIAKRIMEEIGLDNSTIEHVCKIIANHHSARDIDTLEFRILWDADWLVNLGEEHYGEEKLKSFIEKTFKTKTGKERAFKLFLKGKGR